MAAPVLIALTPDMVESIRLQLLARDIDVSGIDLLDAILAAARFETPTEPEPDLFGSL